MAPERPYFIAGRWEHAGEPLQVRNPFDDNIVATTWLADEQAYERAAIAAGEAAAEMRRMPAYRRAEILAGASAEIRRRREEVGRQLALEAGKPIRDALTETDRAVMTFQVAAEEARRLGGELVPMDLAPHGTGRFAVTRRFPIGPVAAISPFNFPLNLAAHKVAPAIAAGNPVVLKPATKTPLSAFVLAEALEHAGLPAGALSVLPMPRPLGDRLVTDDRYKLLTFTGSSAVGWSMKARAGRKKVILELGGNAGVLVDESADLAFAVERVAAGGFSFAGQSCISVQRVYVSERVFDEFSRQLASRVSALRVGDPLDPATDVGPMIEPSEVARVDAWIREALDADARVLTGGRALSPSIYAPTVLVNVPRSARVCAQEVFAPLVALFPFSDFREALGQVNDSAYGLQAGIFTGRLEAALEGFDALEVGGVIVNDVPTWRIDHMPYGGVKESGTGREGPRYTIEEMTELKILVVNRSV
jgi:glyceraldehyde-3-phosphate dehydrogenase (NADP+)